MLKTKEMVFHRPNPRLYIEPPAMQNIERVNEFKLLGVYFCSDLRFNSHISKVLTTCNQRLYLISQLKKQGLTVTGTEIVFNAIVLSKILYALPVFYSFYLSITSNKLKQCLRKLDVGSLLTQILSSRSWLKTTCFVYLDSPNPTLIA